MSSLIDPDSSTLESLMTVASGIHGPEAQSGTEHTAHLADGRLDRLRNQADATYFLHYTATWWREHSSTIAWSMPTRPIEAAMLVRLRQVRDAVQSLASGDHANYERRLRVLANHYTFHLDVPKGGLRPTARGWDAFIATLVPPLAWLATRADQLRRCANKECQWMIFDTTRNGTRTWCHATLCGNKFRVRRFRARQRAASLRRRKPTASRP